MVSRTLFTALVLLVAAQRLAELAVSRRHEVALRARGAVEHAPWQVAMLAVLHGAWLVSMVGEVWWRQPSFRPMLALAALSVFLMGQWLRLVAMRALGDRWSIRVLTLPSTRRVAHGPYAWLPHPNYLGVALEIASLPLVHGAVVTAVVFSVLNAVALTLRIGVEARALAEAEP